MRLLLAEDDAELAQRLKPELESAGYAVDISNDGVDAEFRGDEEGYDAVILDLGLPRRSGLQVLANWRQRDNKVPVLVLTARDAWHERVDGLKAGADDYIGKPFHTEELLARLQAVLRRHHGHATAQIQSGGLVLDEERQEVISAEGAPTALTGTEFRLLRYFMLHPHRILSKSRLADHVYEGDAEPDSNVVEVYVTRLRRKLGAETIETLRGQGYRFPGGSR